MVSDTSLFIYVRLISTQIHSTKVRSLASLSIIPSEAKRLVALGEAFSLIAKPRNAQRSSITASPISDLAFFPADPVILSLTVSFVTPFALPA